MFKSAKGALLCAVLPITLLASAGAYARDNNNDGVGYAGAHEDLDGNWSAARADFESDFRNNPGHPIAVFNEGYAIHRDGDVGKADSLFSEAVVKGMNYVPDGTTEPAGSGITVAEHACARLHRDMKLDPNCGDQIALIAPPAPAVAEAAPPAPEAEATVVPRKQDRN